MADYPYSTDGGGRQNATVEPDGKSVTDSAREKAGDAVRQTRMKAEGSLEDQKQRATGRLDSIGSALRDTSGSLRGQHQENFAGMLDSAAAQVDRLSEYVGSRSVRELIGDVENLARRDPALFLGGAMLLGIVGARFLKSSSRDSHRGPESSFDPYDSGYSDPDFDSGP